jgi:hypothetical protein
MNYDFGSWYFDFVSYRYAAWGVNQNQPIQSVEDDSNRMLEFRATPAAPRSKPRLADPPLGSALKLRTE